MLNWLRENEKQVLRFAALSERRVLKIVECFALDIPSLKTAALCRVNKNTAHRYYSLLRKRVIELAVAENKSLFGEIEVDESYFGPRRGRGAAKKAPVIGLLKRGDCVYVKPVSSCSREELLPIIKSQVVAEATIYTDG